MRIATGIGVFVCLLALAAAPAGSAQSAESATGTTVKGATSSLVNLNTATAAELEALPGIGPRTAERIIEYRQKNGNFKKIEELMNVKGIGEKSFLRIKDRITVAPAARSGQ